MARVTSLLLCLALLLTVAFVNATGGRKNKKGGGYGYQPPQKVIILPAGPSVTYPWVGHCPPKGKCKHIPYVKRPPFPSFLPPAPPLPYYAPIQYVPAYSAPVQQQAYAPPPPTYSPPAYTPPAPQPYAQPAPDYSQSAASGFVPSPPIYSAPAPEANYNSVAPAANPTPYSAAPQEHTPAQQEYASAPAPTQQEYVDSAQAQVIQEIAAPDVQEFSVSAQQEYAAPVADQEYSAPVQQEYTPQAQEEYSTPAAVQEYAAAPVEQEYSSAPAVQEYSGPDTQEFVVQAVQQYAPESAAVETSPLDYSENQPTGEVSVVPAFSPYEEEPSASSAGFDEFNVEQQTAPSWGPVSGPYGASNSAEVQSYSAGGINEPVVVAEPQGNEQTYSSAEAQPEQAVQAFEQPAYSQPSWEPAQQIDSVQPEGTSAPETFDVQGEYTQEEPVQQQPDIIPHQTEAFELELSEQQAAEASEFDENSNYGSRIKPRGAQQRRQN